MKSTVAIIGAGESKGKAIARGLSKEKYPLLLMCAGDTRLDALAEELRAYGSEVELISCAREAAWEADIIVVAVETSLLDKVADKIKEVSVGKYVVTIPYEEKDDTTRLQQLLPYSKVINVNADINDPAIRTIHQAITILNNPITS
jgi:predicted dinucleotide-binding enzyme